MIIKTIISKNPNETISITFYDDNDPFDLILEKHINNNEKTVIAVVDGILEVPASREHRDCWRFKDGKIEVCQVALDAKLKAEKEKNETEESLLSKIGVSKEELKGLIN